MRGLLEIAQRHGITIDSPYRVIGNEPSYGSMADHISDRFLKYTQRTMEKRSVTQFEPTTSTTRLPEDSEAQNRAKRIELLTQQLIEKSLEQHLSHLNRLDGWKNSPWILSSLGMVAGIALFSFGMLFTKFVVLAH